MADQSLKDKTLKGTFWSSADAFLGQGVSFLIGLVLARLLSPAEYGLIGICTIFTSILTGVVDSGFSNAIIRKKDATNDDYNTMFFTNLLVSIVLYSLLFLVSPFIALFFALPELTSLVRAMGLILIFQALSITQVTVLTKRIDFKTKTKASLISAFISGVIGITMAFSGFGVWSLVGQQLSKHLFYSVCLWVFNRWWPALSFCRESFLYMWGFGWKMMLSGLLASVWSHLYQVVVGKFYSPATLGQYSRSKEYASVFSQNFTIIIQRVSFPALSEIQDDTSRMVSAYRRVIKISMFVVSICMVSVAAISEPLLYCLIGPQWHEAATYLPLICISMSLYPLHAINLNMLQVLGRSDVFLIIEIIKKVLSIIPLCLGIFVSIYWMLIGSIVMGIAYFFLNSYYTGRKLHYSSWRQLKDIAPSYLIAFAIALSVYFLRFLPFSYYLILPIQILVGVLVFFIICEMTKPQEYLVIKEIMAKGIKKVLR